MPLWWWYNFRVRVGALLAPGKQLPDTRGCALVDAVVGQREVWALDSAPHDTALLARARFVHV